MSVEDNRGSPPRTPLFARVERRLPEIYLVFGLVLTGLVCFLTAPFFGPDEPDQSSRAIELGHGSLMAHLGPSLGGEEAGAEIDSGAIAAMDGMDDIREAWEASAPDFLDRPYGPVTEDAQRRWMYLGWARRTEFLPFGNTAGYPPALYLPAVVGWRVGEAAGMTIFASLRLARLLCAVTAVALGWLALRLGGRCRWMLLPFLVLPSTLFLNASCSQDAVLLGVAGLLAAMLCRPLSAQREFTPAELAFTAALLALCGTARPPYLAMAALLFLPSLERRGGLIADRQRPDGTQARSLRQRWLAPSTAFAGVVAAGAVWMRLVAPLGLEHSDEARPELQAAFLRAHPVAALRALIDGTGYALGDFVRRGIYVVGWNDLLPHRGLAGVLAACIAVAVVFAPASPVRTWRGRLLLAAGVAVPLLGISLAEYVIWTPPAWHTVNGIQPRYWLPVMPFATMLFSGAARGVLDEATRRYVLLGAATALTLIACTLPWMVAHAFYNESVWRVLRLNLP
jgi:uncharacterized membrane protein